MTQSFGRRRLLAGVAGVGLAGVAGCAESTAESDGETTFTVGLSSDPTSTNSYDTWGGMAPYWTRVVEPLVWGTPDMQPKPWLATDWTDIDETTWEFELREGVRFHNGEELTADDVVHSFEEDILTERGDFVHGWLHLEPGSVTKIDDYTVEFETREPFPGFPGTIAHNMIDIQPPEADRRAGEIVGTGPFTLEEIEHGRYVRVERFDDYWGGAPEPSELTFRAAEDATTRTDLLVGDEVDVIYDPARSRLSSLRERDDVWVRTQQDTSATSVWINLYREPTDDRALRRALNYAISQDEIVETVLEGVGNPARGPISTAIDWADDDELPSYPRDRDTARDLVAESAYDGEELVCLVDNDMDGGRDLAQILQAEFDEIGVSIETELLERASLQDRTDSGEFHLEIGGTGSNSPAADYLMWENFHTQGIDNVDQYEADGTGLFNLGGEVDELIETGYQTRDREEKHDAYAEALKKIVDAAVVVPLFYEEYAVAADTALDGIDLHPIGALVEWHDLHRDA